MESPVLLRSDGFSHRFYLLKVPNFFFFGLLLSQKFCLTIISPELYHCVCYFNCNFYSLAGQCPALHIYIYMHLYYMYCFLCSVTEPSFGWGYVTVSLPPSSIPATWFPKNELNYFLNYQTCLKFGVIHINIDMFFWVTSVEMHFGCMHDLIAFCNEFLMIF